MLNQLKNDTLLMKTVDAYLKAHYWKSASFYQIFKLSEWGEILQIKEGFEVYICSENIEILGLIASCGNGITLVHFIDERAKSKYAVLKTLLALKPSCLKGDPFSVNLAKQILDKSILEVVDEQYDWMNLDGNLDLDLEQERLELIEMLRVYEGKGLKIKTADELDFQTLIPFLIEVEKCFNRNPLSINQLKKKMTDRVELDAYLMTVFKDQVVGQGLLEYALPKHKLIGGIYTSEKFRNKGMGHLITRALIQIIRDMDRIPALTVESTNTTAIQLYEQLGFKCCGAQQNSNIKLKA